MGVNALRNFNDEIDTCRGRLVVVLKEGVQEERVGKCKRQWERGGEKERRWGESGSRRRCGRERMRGERKHE